MVAENGWDGLQLQHVSNTHQPLSCMNTMKPLLHGAGQEGGLHLALEEGKEVCLASVSASCGQHVLPTLSLLQMQGRDNCSTVSTSHQDSKIT